MPIAKLHWLCFLSRFREAPCFASNPVRTAPFVDVNCPLDGMTLDIVSECSHEIASVTRKALHLCSGHDLQDDSI